MSQQNQETGEDRPDEITERVARTYSAAADHYELPALGFWDRWGDATVSRLALRPGDAVLDLCCGAGASALAAARVVGAAGRVLGIDAAQPLLELARAKAEREGLNNSEFRRGDATRTGLSSGSFDAVICVFGVFFAPNMPAFVAEMWRMVRPGGALAITTWGPDWCEPASTAFWNCVRDVEPSLYRKFNPWDEIVTPPALADLLARGGVADARVEAVPAQHELRHPDEFWDIALGSGYRGTLDALTGDQQGAVRDKLLAKLRAGDVTSLGNDVVFGAATRPGARRATAPPVAPTS